MNEKKSHKVVFALTERQGKTYWMRVGVAWPNRDGSLTLQLDAIPISGKLQVREPEVRDEAPWEPRRRPNFELPAQLTGSD
ncbi:MAG: hypothetical protein KF901_15080 [Myxococcales bacterium]|nr:hypothetical protein [Myxococcales bacterium]